MNKKRAQTDAHTLDSTNEYSTRKMALSSETKETRLDSYIKRPTPRQELILEILGDEQMTRRQIMVVAHYRDINQVSPRISELLKEGKIETCGKAYDHTTRRNVTLYRRVADV